MKLRMSKVFNEIVKNWHKVTNWFLQVWCVLATRESAIKTSASRSTDLSEVQSDDVGMGYFLSIVALFYYDFNCIRVTGDNHLNP